MPVQLMFVPVASAVHCANAAAGMARAVVESARTANLRLTNLPDARVPRMDFAICPAMILIRPFVTALSSTVGEWRLRGERRMNGVLGRGTARFGGVLQWGMGGFLHIPGRLVLPVGAERGGWQRVIRLLGALIWRELRAGRRGRRLCNGVVSWIGWADQQWSQNILAMQMRTMRGSSGWAWISATPFGYCATSDFRRSTYQNSAAAAWVFSAL